MYWSSKKFNIIPETKTMLANSNNLISIVIPVYNAENTLLNCIKSILTQDYTNIELILVNDGSVDTSGKICDEAVSLDKRVRVVHQENHGVSAARNAGVEKATGDFLMFVDSDDQMLPGMIQRMYSYSDNKFGMVVCGYEKKTNNKDKISYIFNENVSESHIDKKDVVLIYKKGLLNSPCNKLYNMKLIKEKKIKFETWCSMGEDLIFNMKYISLMSGDIIIINEMLYLYNFENKWISSLSKRPLFYDATMKEYLYVVKYAKKIGIKEIDYFYEIMLYIGLQSLENYYVYNETDDRKEKLTKIKEKIHDRRFKKLIVYLRKHKKIGRIKFWLLYNEWYQVHGIMSALLRKIRG